jgi:mono/diheme cytochrome c family protein
VAVAGALSNTPPANGPRAVRVATRAIEIEREMPAGPLDLRLSADILGVQDDRLLVEVSRRDGAPVGDIQRLIVASSVLRPGESTSIEVDRVDATLVATSPLDATYAVSAAGLAAGGVWMLKLTVRRAGIPDEVGGTTIDSTTWSFLSPRLVEDAWRPPRVPPGVPVLLLTAAVVLVVGFRGVRGSRTIEPLPAVIILVAVVAIAAGFTVQAVQQIDATPAGSDVTSPTDEPDLIAAGNDYRTYCLACHGVDGGGVDDTDPQHDHGSGTDLLDDDTRRRSDGDLFALTSGGVSGTTMPAYDVALTEQERWALVTYLRGSAKRSAQRHAGVLSADALVARCMERRTGASKELANVQDLDVIRRRP